MANVYELKHPLIQHKLAILRNKNTGVKEFRELVGEIAGLMCYEATRNLPTEEVEVETPVAVAKCQMLAGKKLAIIPILRAGLGMVDSMVDLIPSAKIGHIGLYRDHETHQPVEYYCKLPSDIAEREVIVLDPMLATGGSAIDAITKLKERGVKQIKFMCIIAAPEGVEALIEAGCKSQVKIMVGGAPITQEFADEIGADCYTSDAASAAEAAVALCNA